MQAQLRWTGHVIRMQTTVAQTDAVFPTYFKEEELFKPCKQFKDGLKNHLKNGSIPVDSWEMLASDRDLWQIRVSRHMKNSVPKTGSKAAMETETTVNRDFVCEICGQICRSRIGLFSHLRCHER